MNADVPLGEGDFDAGGVEGVMNGGVEFGGDAKAVFNRGQVATKDKAQGAVVKSFKGGKGAGFGHNERMVFGGVEEDLAGFFSVGAISDADFDNDAVDGVGERPVENSAGDEFFVGDDEFLAAPVGDGGGADADFGDHAADVGDGDDVAHANGAFGEEDDAADEVGDHFLESEAKPDAEGGHNPAKLGKSKSEDVESEDCSQENNGVLRDGDDGVAAARRQRKILENADFQHAGNIADGDDCDDGDEQA